MTDFATFIVSALLAFGIGVFVIVLGLATYRHFAWTRRVRKRIGWYS
jgi:hypothetical protein